MVTKMSTKREKIHCTNCGTEWFPTEDDLLKIQKGWTIQCPKCNCEITKKDYQTETEATQNQASKNAVKKNQAVRDKLDAEAALNRASKTAAEKWYVNDNFVSRKLNDKDWHGDDVVTECDSHETALEIAAAHNLKDITKEIVDAALDRASQMSKAELFLRELRATDDDDYAILSDRIAALVEELGMEAAELTIYELYSMTNKIESTPLTKEFNGFKSLGDKKVEPVVGSVFLKPKNAGLNAETKVWNYTMTFTKDIVGQMSKTAFIKAVHEKTGDSKKWIAERISETNNSKQIIAAQANPGQLMEVYS